MTNPKTNLRRHLARRCAVQALYQWQHTHQLASEIIQQFTEDDLLQRADYQYFAVLVNGTIENSTGIDDLLREYIDRSIDKLNPVELAIMRTAIFELQQCLHVPYKVVLNEALVVAKEFGADQGHKYVNAILHQLVPKLRAAEMSSVK